MKTLFPLIAVLAAITAPLQADVLVESNLVVSLKFYFNQSPEVETPKFTTRKYSSASIKNADLISAFARANGGTFSKKAKLIRVDRCDGVSSGTILSTRYYIRDNGSDTDITTLFSVVKVEEDEVKSYKRVNETSTETGTYLNLVSLDYFVEDINTPDDEFFEASGMEKGTKKIIKYQEQFATLLSSSHAVTGPALFQSSTLEVPLEGLVQGTIKATGPKAVALVD